MKDLPKKDLILSLISSGVVLVPAFLFSLKSDLPHVFIICALLLGFSVLKRRAVEMGDRPIIYFAVLSAILATFLDMAIPMNDGRGGILDILIKSSLAAPALLYMASFATFFAQKPMTFGIVAALSVTVMISGGDIFRASNLTPERLFFAKPLTAHFTFLYIYCVAAETLFLIAGLQALRRYNTQGAGRVSLATRSSARAVCLALLPGIAIVGALAFYANEKRIRQIERLIVGADFVRRGSPEELPFSEEPDLTKGLPKEDANMAAKIVARVRAKSPPGLLRAKGYSSYDEGRWSNPSHTARELQGTHAAEAISSRKFTMPGQERPDSVKQLRLEVFQSSGFSSNILLIPANSNALELVAEKLSVSGNGLVEPTEWKPDAGFTSFVDAIDQNAAYREPVPVAKEYLDVPEKLKASLAEIASQAREIAAKKPRDGEASLAEAVASAIRARCQYSLEVKDSPEGVDPVENFLVNTRKGHCELFASAATLTLRSMGIPSRYVAGVVCDETHPSGAYFVARLGGAHAWCEAFLRDQGRWVIVEATPASALDLNRGSWGIFDSLSDWIGQTFRQSIAWLQRGYFAQAVFDLAGDIILLLWSIASSKAGLLAEALLACVSAISLTMHLAKRRRRLAEIPETMRRLQKEFRRVEEAASARSGISRADSMTVREWAELARPSCGDALPEIVIAYEALRYRENPPDASAVEAFKKEAELLLKTFKTSTPSRFSQT